MIKKSIRRLCLLLLTMLLIAQISVIAQEVKIPAHLDPQAKKSKPVYTKVAEIIEPVAVKGCVSGNCIDGFGKMIKDNNEVYEGNWKNGMKEGQGTISSSFSTYTGNWHEDMYQGYGEYKEFVNNDGKKSIMRMYTGNFEQFDFKGQGKCIMYTTWPKISFVMEGNFERQQLLGKGSLFIPNEGTYYSDNFTNNFNFTTGRFVKENATEKIEGSLNGGFFTALNASSNNTSTATTSSSHQSTSLLDYGIYAPKRKTTSPSNPTKTHDYKVYCFVSTCSQGSKQFRVLSKVTADIGRHTLDEMKADAAHRISNNGWFLQTSLEYLGLSTDITITGTPGKDYAVSATDMYDF